MTLAELGQEPTRYRHLVDCYARRTGETVTEIDLHAYCKIAGILYDETSIFGEALSVAERLQDAAEIVGAPQEGRYDA